MVPVGCPPVSSVGFIQDESFGEKTSKYVYKNKTHLECPSVPWSHTPIGGRGMPTLITHTPLVCCKSMQGISILYTDLADQLIGIKRGLAPWVPCAKKTSVPVGGATRLCNITIPWSRAG